MSVDVRGTAMAHYQGQISHDQYHQGSASQDSVTDSRLSPVGREMEPDEKEQEDQIKFELEAFRPYIVQMVNYRDLLFYEYFSLEERKAFRDLGKIKTGSEVTEQMIDAILGMKDKSDKFSKLVKLFESELDHSKVVQILRGKKIPANRSIQKEHIKKISKELCDNIHVSDLLPHLLKYNLINETEAERLANEQKNNSKFDAALDLLFIISNKCEYWYQKFIICLLQSGQEDIAKKVDINFCNEYETLKQSKQTGDESLNSMEEKSLFQDGPKSLISIQPACSQTASNNFGGNMKSAYQGELTLDENTQLKTIPGVKLPYTNEEFATLEAPVLKDQHEPSLVVNNLSPNKGEEDSMASRADIELTKRSLEDKLSTSTNTDMSMSFSYLLDDSENERVKLSTDSSLKRYNSSEPSLGQDSIRSGYSTSDNSGDFNSYLYAMQFPDSDVSNSQKSLQSNTFNSELQVHGKPSLSQYQLLHKAKPEESADTAAVNTAFSEHSSRTKEVNYSKNLRENSQSPTFKELKDKDVNIEDGVPQMHALDQFNITESADDVSMNKEVEDVDISLREYQQELAAPAISGKNVIIVAPTGSGKTRVAFKIMQEHIRQQKGHGIAKVIFLVNQVALANQQGDDCRKLLCRYSSKVITGESQKKRECLKDFIDKRDILIVTAQVLLDSLLRKEISSISRFSLIVFDECHHTHANHTFNQIMGQYMDLKFDKSDTTLPQIVGLTASVGVGKARNIEKAVEHIKHLMANLDAQVICTVQKNVTELRQHVSLPEEETYTVPKRQNDKFQGNVVKLMNTIEKMMAQSSLVKEMPEASKFEGSLKAPAQKGTPQYTQWVSKLWKETAKLRNPEARRFLNPGRAHLEHYNKALIIHNDARLEDAREYLDIEMGKWKENAVMDVNETKLYGAFKLLRDANYPNCPNPKLDKLSEVIQKTYRNNWENSRGIVFVKTRDLCKAVISWMKETPGLRELNPVPFVGTNMAADKGGMTKAEQVDALQYFRDGKHKLIVATSVAEEGLDISKCNLVIRYDHVTNEIAMVQSRGRGRAADSKYTVISEDKKGMAEKEELNMIREVMMRKAINELQSYIKNNPQTFQHELKKFQDEANLDRQLKSLGSRRRLIRTGMFELRCVKCDHFVCWSDDVKKIEGSHHVVVDDHLTQRVSFVRSGSSRYQDETIQIFGKIICKECGGNLGVICIHKTIEFPVLKIENFLIVDTNGRQDTCKRWKSVPFNVEALSTEDWRNIIKARKESGDISL